jgi:cyanate permease
LGLVFSLPVLALALFALIGGVMADIVGPRKTGALGLALVGLGGLLRGYSTDLVSLLLFSAIFGAGWGLTLPTLPKIVAGWFQKAAVGTATGVYTTGIYVGAGLSTAVGISGFWRTNLVLWGMTGVLISLVWWALIRDPPSVPSAPASFRSVARDHRLWALTAIFFLGANVTFYTLTGWLPTFLSTKVPGGEATFIASFMSFFGAPATILIPLLSDRVRRRRPFLMAACLFGASGAFLLFNGPPQLLATSVAVLGVCVSAVFVICLTLPSELVDKSLVGSASGFMLLAYAGGVIGPWLSGITQDITASFASTTLLLVASFLVSAALVALLPETGRTMQEPP